MPIKNPFNKQPEKDPEREATTPVRDAAAPELPPKVTRDIGPATGNQNQQQVDRRNLIADGADTIRDADLSDVGEDREVVETAPETPEVVETPVVTPEPERRFKLKVNGKELDLSESEVLARAQKVESADEYLRASQEAAKVALNAGLPVKDVPAEKAKDFRAVARAIQMGTEDEAAEAVRQLLEAKPSVTPDVSQVVDQRLALRDEQAKFRKDYADIVSDPHLLRLAVAEEAKLLEQSPEMPLSERWPKAGEAVREWKKGLTPANPTDDKAARKALVAPVPAAAGRQNTKPDDEPSDDPKSVIEQMAKNRGQGRSVQH